MAEIKQVPELRFPGFEGGWEEKRFDKIYSFKVTNSYSRDKLNYEVGDVKNIHYGDIHTKFNSLFDINLEQVPYINDDIDVSRIPEECYLQVGDLVIADASEDYNDIGKFIEIINLNEEKILAGLHTFLARRESNDTAIGFASFLMKSRKVRLEVMRIAQGTKVLSISNKRLAELLLFYPTCLEQQKIITFLTTINQRLQLLQQKKRQLISYKKDLMQKLFTQDLRFKEDSGSSFPNWEEKQLGDYYKNLRTGMTPYRGKPEYYNGDILWITSGELNYNLIDDTREKITAKAVEETNLRIYPPFTFFIAITGLEAPGTRGKCAINRIQSTTNQSCMAFEKVPEIDTKFLYYWYCEYGTKLYFKYAQGTKQQSFNNSIVEKFDILVPSPNEQKKIADFLTSLDEGIALVAGQIESTSLYKKGLLQKMFV